MRAPLSATLEALGLGSSQPYPRYLVGDVVEVLNAARLPKVEEVIGRGTVERITREDEPLDRRLYWVDGFPCAKTARQLRLVVRAR